MAPPAKKKPDAKPAAKPLDTLRHSTAPHGALKSQMAANAQAAAPDPAQAPVAGPDQPIPGAPGEQLQVRVNARDLPPIQQAQLAQKQLGIDPFAPIEMAQQAVQQNVGQPDQQQNGLPTQLTAAGGLLPSDGSLSNFAHDFGALHEAMARGYSPGASPAEHAVGQNAHAIARAQSAMQAQNAQNVDQHAGATQGLGAILQQLVMHGAPPAAAGPPPMDPSQGAPQPQLQMAGGPATPMDLAQMAQPQGPVSPKKRRSTY